MTNCTHGNKSQHLDCGWCLVSAWASSTAELVVARIFMIGARYCRLGVHRAHRAMDTNDRKQIIFSRTPKDPNRPTIPATRQLQYIRLDSPHPTYLGIVLFLPPFRLQAVDAPPRTRKRIIVHLHIFSPTERNCHLLAHRKEILSTVDPPADEATAKYNSVDQRSTQRTSH